MAVEERRRAMIDRDRELWGIALNVEHRHGSEGPMFIAGMIGKATMKGDPVGVALWREVAARFGQLVAASNVA
ncbi:DUF6961 family protein [Sphingomonas sp. MMS12-HWE2-04]|uniref:DUF6961 family protein n=1 Tax=Sphingomonas sp. MMS12-HWE2-04 TaxID=3234199 RepID=UPI00384E79FB